MLIQCSCQKQYTILFSNRQHQSQMEIRIPISHHGDDQIRSLWNLKATIGLLHWFWGDFWQTHQERKFKGLLSWTCIQLDPWYWLSFYCDGTNPTTQNFHFLIDSNNYRFCWNDTNILVLLIQGQKKGKTLSRYINLNKNVNDTNRTFEHKLTDWKIPSNISASRYKTAPKPMLLLSMIPFSINSWKALSSVNVHFL